MTFKALHSISPIYITDLITPYVPFRSLRSTNAGLLVAPKMKLKKTGEHCFRYACAILWNELPSTIRSSDDLVTFKSLLKTNLFTKYYK